MGANRYHITKVHCTWNTPDLTAEVVFKDGADAETCVVMLAEDSHMLRGRRPSFSRNEKMVVLKSLDFRTTREELTEYISNTGPVDIHIRSESHAIFQSQIERRVQHLLGQHGKVLRTTVTKPSQKGVVHAYVQFSNAHEACEAVRLLDDTTIYPEETEKLRVRHLVTVEICLHSCQMDALGRTFLGTADQFRLKDNVTITVVRDSLNLLNCFIRIIGPNRKSVAHVRTEIENLVGGIVVTAGTELVSDPYFFSPKALSLFEKIKRSHNVITIADQRRKVLRMFGPKVRLEGAHKAFTDSHEFTSRKPKTILLGSLNDVVARSRNWQLTVATLSQSRVKMIVSPRSQRVVVKCNGEELQEVQKLLKKNHKPTRDIPQCPVCFCDVRFPIQISCGHCYCRDCLFTLITKTPVYPITCAARGCFQSPTLEALQNVLTYVEFEIMLKASLVQHIRTHPQDFHYCPTPDCDRFYRNSSPEDPIVFDCDRCFSSTCTGCHTLPHEGQACAAARATEATTDEFAKSQRANKVFNCPACNSPIQRDGGCVNLKCIVCECHICWICMKGFKTSSRVYKHIAAEHAEIEETDYEDYFEDD